MAKTFYVPVSGESVKPKKWYVPVNGESAKVVKAYCSVNGESKQFWGDEPAPVGPYYYLLKNGQIPKSSTANPWVYDIARYNGTQVFLLDAGSDYEHLYDVQGVFNTLTFGNKKIFTQTSYNTFWAHDASANKWVYNTGAMKKTVNTSGEVNAIFIPINRIYANTLRIKVNAKGQGYLDIGCHGVSNLGSLVNYGHAQIELTSDYVETEVSINCSGGNIDYISLDATNTLNDTSGAEKYVKDISINGMFYKNCIMADKDDLYSFYSQVPLPVSKNSITITHNNETTTVSKVDGNDDVYFCYSHYIEEYGSAELPRYWETIMIFAVSRSPFKTNGNQHAETTGTVTTHGCTYSITDTHYIQANLESTPWPSTIPLCNIAPFSRSSGVLADLDPAIGEAFCIGNIYEQ